MVPTLYTLTYWVFRLPLLSVPLFVRFADSFQYASMGCRMSHGHWPDFGLLPLSSCS
jgi:hypothetical protein